MPFVFEQIGQAAPDLLATDYDFPCGAIHDRTRLHDRFSLAGQHDLHALPIDAIAKGARIAV